MTKQQEEKVKLAFEVAIKEALSEHFKKMVNKNT